MAKRVLCPVDFSDCSHGALSRASQLVAECHGKLFVLHVDQGGPGNPPGTSGYVEELDHHRTLLREWNPTEDNIDYEQHYTRGNVIDEIQRFARLRDIDLIVMGTHGRSGFSKAMLGSVAESVDKHAPCEVMTVCSESHV